MKEAGRLGLVILLGCFVQASAAEPPSLVLLGIREGKIAPDEALRAVAKEPAAAREEIYMAAAGQATRYADLLCAGLHDRAANVVPLLCEALTAKTIGAERLKNAAREAYASPHAFVRQRAAELMFHLDPTLGRKWLLAEEAVFRQSHQATAVECTGYRTGFPGIIQRLLNPLHAASEATNDPVLIPANTFNVEVMPLPTWGDRQWSIRFVNATGKDFAAYPSYEYACMPSLRSHGKGEDEVTIPQGERGSLASCPKHAIPIRPGACAFYVRFSLPRALLTRLEKLTVTFEITLPGPLRARYAYELPASRFQDYDDLQALKSGLLSPDAPVRHAVLAVGIHPLPAVHRAPPEQCEPLFDLLLQQLKKQPPQGLNEATGELSALTAWMMAFGDALTEPRMDRLLAVPDLKFWLMGDVNLRKKILARALSGDQPAAANNAGRYLHRNPEQSLLAEMQSAANRWLASPDERLKRAGLQTGLGALTLGGVVPRWADVARTALGGDDLELRQVALDGMPRFLPADPAALAAALQVRHAGLREAAIAALARILTAEPRAAGFDSQALREMVAPLLRDPPDVLPEQRAALLNLASQYLADAPFFASYLKDTSDYALMGTLVNLQWDFGSPVLKALKERGLLTSLESWQRHALCSMELERLAKDAGTTVGAYYTAELKEAIRSGNPRAAVACLPLALDRDSASGQLLHVALKALRDETVWIAAVALRERNPALRDELLGYLRREMPDAGAWQKKLDSFSIIAP